MPLGQGEPRIARQAAEQLDAGPLERRPIIARCRALATRLRITPAMPTSSRKLAQPAATAAAVSIWPFTSSTSTTGQPKRRGDIGRAAAPARAVEQAHHAFGDDEVGRMAHDEVGQHAARHRPAVEIVARPSRGDGMERRIDIVGPALVGLHASSPRRAKARIRPSATVVLPAPERTAETIRPRSSSPADQARQHLPAQAGDRADHHDGRRADAVAPAHPRPAGRACSRRPRSSSVVADCSSAAGVSAAMPPFISAAVMPASCVIGM